MKMPSAVYSAKCTVHLRKPGTFGKNVPCLSTNTTHSHHTPKAVPVASALCRTLAPPFNVPPRIARENRKDLWWPSTRKRIEFDKIASAKKGTAAPSNLKYRRVGESNEIYLSSIPPLFRGFERASSKTRFRSLGALQRVDVIIFTSSTSCRGCRDFRRAGSDKFSITGKGADSGGGVDEVRKGNSSTDDPAEVKGRKSAKLQRLPKSLVRKDGSEKFMRSWRGSLAVRSKLGSDQIASIELPARRSESSWGIEGAGSGGPCGEWRASGTPVASDCVETIGVGASKETLRLNLKLELGVAGRVEDASKPGFW
ncbi:hypothetical protein B0H11DRAFT_1914693 [Mycena galericulata]|nr:hypothetical protein B0H11DRAFT_1914693 [Mycena galericulata]